MLFTNYKTDKAVLRCSQELSRVQLQNVAGAINSQFVLDAFKVQANVSSHSRTVDGAIGFCSAGWNPPIIGHAGLWA